jgi:hypothetical protein
MAIDQTIENYFFIAKEILNDVWMFSCYAQKIQSLPFDCHN